MTFEEMLEQLYSHYTSEQFQMEVLEAKREFFENAGVIDEESELYDIRMSQFLDWYLFSRDLRDLEVPPIVDSFRTNPLQIEEDDLPTLRNLVNHRHSLYELAKIKTDLVIVKDLFTGEKLEVVNSAWILSYDKKSIFEARLIPDGTQFHFTRGICFHPVEGRKYILGEIKKCRDSELQDRRLMMLRLMKLRYKFEVYKHVSFKEIYSDDFKIRV